MLDSISLNARLISLESMSASQVLNASTERMPEFITDIKNFIGELFTFDKDDTPEIKVSSNLLRGLKGTVFTDIAQLRTATPPGLSVDFNEYLDVLSSFGYDKLSTLIPSVLLPFNKYLAIVITDPAKLSSVRSDRNIPNLELYDVEGIKRSISDCFDTKRVDVFSTVEKCYRSTSDIVDVSTKLNKLVARVHGVDQKEISLLVESISDRLNTLMEVMDDKSIKVSGNSVKVIVDISYAIARECEFFSVYRYQLQAFAQAVKETNDLLEEQLKSK